jgi:hypothetical protein
LLKEFKKLLGSPKLPSYIIITGFWNKKGWGIKAIKGLRDTLY